jgi:hypothetical protein
LPAAIEDTDPLEREGTGRGLMGTACCPLLRIVGTRPKRLADGFPGPFHEGLSQKLRVLAPPVDPTRVPTAFGDRRKARILLEFGGRGKAFAWFATGDEETRGEDGTGAWERVKEGEVGMRWGQWRDGAVEVNRALAGWRGAGPREPGRGPPGE